MRNKEKVQVNLLVVSNIKSERYDISLTGCYAAVK